MNLDGNQTNRFNYRREGEGFWVDSRRQTAMVNKGILDKAFQSPHVRVGGLFAEFSFAGSGLVGISPPPTFPGRGDQRRSYLQLTHVGILE